jgi:hypothetical protein
MRAIPEHAFRACFGIIRLGRHYGNARVDLACGKALKLNIVGYRHIDSMLKTGRDKIPPGEENARKPVEIVHENIRGANYYRGELQNAY